MNNLLNVDNLSELESVLFSEDNKPIYLPVCDHYAGNPKFFSKAMTFKTNLGDLFDITLDLEDGARVGEEIEQAIWVVEALKQYADQFNHKLRMPGVRLNHFEHPAFSQQAEIILAQEVAPSPSYLMIPKPACLNAAQESIQTLKRLAAKIGNKPLPPIHLIIETHGAVAEVQGIAKLDEIESLSFGLMDFISSHRSAISQDAFNSPEQFNHALVRRAKIEIAAACHRFGKVPSHNVTRDIKNPKTAFNDALRAKKELGFTRMWSIHPNQIEPIIQALQPSNHEIKKARQILFLAKQANWAPIEFEGELHDRASYRYYFEILKLSNVYH